MAHIKVPEGVPGIRSLVMFRPETGKPLYELAQVLLRGESTLSEAERELIAAYVSKRNHTMFCMMSHAAASRELFGDNKQIVDDVLEDITNADISKKMKALLNIASKVQVLGKEVKPEDVEFKHHRGHNKTYNEAKGHCMAHTESIHNPSGNNASNQTRKRQHNHGGTAKLIRFISIRRDALYPRGCP